MFQILIMVFDCPLEVSEVIKNATGANYIYVNIANSVNTLRSKFSQSATGTFYCPSCRRTWDSFKVSVTLQFSHDKRHFNIQLCGQKCRSCTEDFCKPTLSESEWARLTARFEEVLQVPRPRNNNNSNQDPTRGDSEKPHDSVRCEACQLGMCNLGV